MYFTPVEFLIRIFIVVAVVGLICFFCGRAYELSKTKNRRSDKPGPYYEKATRGRPNDA